LGVWARPPGKGLERGGRLSFIDFFLGAIFVINIAGVCVSHFAQKIRLVMVRIVKG
jgi:hypothetical protein